VRTVLVMDRTMTQKKTPLSESGHPVRLDRALSDQSVQLFGLPHPGRIFQHSRCIFHIHYLMDARRLLDGSYLVLLGVAYLCVGSIDILHTLAFKGMGIFPAYDTNLPTQFWIAARYMEALSLMAVPLLIKKKVNPERAFALYFAISFVLIASILDGSFRIAIIEGIGLTEFKKNKRICNLLHTFHNHLINDKET